jgi:EAL domain-containing protein (putative c-di-GMP-specific phosphodiesterase class I)/CHASE2 domain-containing sensor protein
MALNLNKAKIGRKILLFVALFGVLGAVGFFQPVSLLLYTVQTKAAVKPVSGDIVVVGIDSNSINSIGRWPWPRDKQAELLRNIDGYDPNSVYIDIVYQGRTTHAADSALRNTLQTMSAPTTIITQGIQNHDGSVGLISSHVAAVGNTQSATAYLPYLFGFIWDLPTSIVTENGQLQSLAGSMAKRDGPPLSKFRINYGYDPNSIPVFSAKDIMDRSIDPSKLEGKTVILGVTDVTQNDIHSMPGWGEWAGVLFHVMGAETLKAGMPKEWGWLPFFGLAVVICSLFLSRRSLQFSQPINWSVAFGILSVSTWLTTLHIGNDPVPALALLGTVGFYIARQKAALVRTKRHSETGISDMTGYMVEEVVSNALFVGATVSRAETRLGYVRPQDELTIAKEVGRRLSTVIDEQQLTHNDKTQFLWEMPNIPTSKLAEHLEGLRQLFADPLVIDGRKIDVDINFGVDRNSNNNIRSRMENALAASVAASQSKSTFKIATTNDFRSHLKSQFAAELATSIANGDIELMFEAQKNLANNLVETAEASIRWTHPAHGQIATSELFTLARDSGNLQKLSDYLCEQTMIAAGNFAKQFPDFALSVKISMDIVLMPNFGAKMLGTAEKNACKPANIIFNVIGVHDFKYNELARKAFRDLQRHGFGVGVGDFGMTHADLDLLEIFKPSEVFLAKSFSAELLGSTSNQMFAASALRIARASNIITTADGIDDRDVLLALSRSGCDRGKGKIISMPLNFNDFILAHLPQKAKKVG